MPMTSISGKVSVHVGKRWSRKHNLRDYDKEKWNKDGHIDENLTKHNVVHTDHDPLQFFKDNFTEALMKYNEKELMKHPERVIGRKEYQRISELKRNIKNAATDKEKKSLEKKLEKLERELPDKVIKEYYQQQKGNIQEVIFQMSDHENFLKMCEEQGREKALEIHKAYLKKCYEDFVKDYPSLKVISAVSHVDEISLDGTPHLHLDFLPVAESSKGLTVKVSLEAALSSITREDEKGKETHPFKRSKSDTYDNRPYTRFLKDVRQRAEERGAEYITVIPSEHSNARHEDPDLYKQRKKREQLNAEVESLNAEIKSLDIDLQTVKAVEIPPRPELPQPPILPDKPIYYGVDYDKTAIWKYEHFEVKKWEKDCEKIKAKYEKDLQKAREAQEEWDKTYTPIQAAQRAIEKTDKINEAAEQKAAETIRKANKRQKEVAAYEQAVRNRTAELNEEYNAKFAELDEQRKEISDTKRAVEASAFLKAHKLSRRVEGISERRTTRDNADLQRKAQNMQTAELAAAIKTIERTIANDEQHINKGQGQRSDPNR